MKQKQVNKELDDISKCNEAADRRLNGDLQQTKGVVDEHRTAHEQCREREANRTTQKSSDCSDLEERLQEIVTDRQAYQILPASGLPAGGRTEFRFADEWLPFLFRR